jgi:hypothetical protein
MKREDVEATITLTTYSQFVATKGMTQSILCLTLSEEFGDKIIPTVVAIQFPSWIKHFCP